MYELPINKKHLNTLIKEVRNRNEFPVFLPRYLPSDGKDKISIYLEKLVNEAFNFLKIMNDDEIKSLVKSLPQGITMITGAMPEWGDDEEKRRLAVSYIASEVQRKFFDFKSAIANSADKSVVLKKFPELKERFDKDGLLIIDDDFILHEGGIEYKDHILHYSQFLRRRYTSNPNFDFLERLVFYYINTRPTNKLRIAIDHRRLMHKEFYSQIFEADTWFGPPFNSEKIDDPNEVGLTVIKRNKDSLFELTNNLDRTEFYWSFNKKDVKTFEIEEISNPKFKFDNYIFNKYLHSERNILSHKFIHIDGAVKIYLKNDYKIRYEAYMPNENKCYKKVKLWRLDGKIDLKNWIDLISFFYKSNEMIIEYFNPEEFKRIFELRIRDKKKWDQERKSRSTT